MTDYFHRKQLKALQLRRDDLRNKVRTMTENNSNMKLEIMGDKIEMVRTILDALEIKKSISRKNEDVARIFNEIQSILGSYCSHLEVLAEEAEKDCELDWKMFLAGEIETFEDFLETFIGHRKDFHSYRVKASRLSKDLCLLNEILISSANSSDGSDC